MSVGLGARVLVVFVAAVLTAASPALLFEDVTASSQLNFKHENSATTNKYLIETMGGGVAVFDYDNEGWLDVFFTNGAKLKDPMPAAKAPDKSEPRFSNRLYRNNRDGTFTDVTRQAGLGGPATSYSIGAAVGDYDNDGFQDLYLTAYGSNILYRNRGDGTFEDVTAHACVAASGWSSSAGFFDYDNDGWLDLFVGRYLEWSFANNIYCGERKPGYRAYCHPDNFSGITNLLYRNNGDGTFSDVSERAGIANPEGKALGVAFADYDQNGWTDIYVANDSVMSFLYRNNGDGTFTDVSLLDGAGYNDDGKAFAGMGVDFADYDNDGLPDIFVTTLSNQTYTLYRNNGDSTFSYVTHRTGVGQATLLYSGWGTKFVDLDNDSWKDIFVAQGHVLDHVELTQNYIKYLQPPLLLRNTAGRFAAVPAEVAGAAFGYPWAGRGAAFGDLDNDGDIDIVVSNVGQKAYLLRNEAGNRHHWLALALEGTRSNRDGLGCRVKLVPGSGPAQYYEVSTAASYLSASDKRLLIGLGRHASIAQLEIRWPSGAVQRLENVVANRLLTVREPKE